MSARVLVLELEVDGSNTGCVVHVLARAIRALTHCTHAEATAAIEVTQMTTVGPLFLDAPGACRVHLDDGTRIELEEKFLNVWVLAIDAGGRYSVEDIERSCRSVIR